MKKDTRQIILDTAKRLFNERGYNGVSLKDIADEIGISKGNLTYHFRKKEDIMESLLLNEPKSRPLSTATTLEELDCIFTDMQKKLQEHSYYFLHHAQLSDVSPKISQTQNYAYKEIVSIFQNAFTDLYAAGFIKEAGFQNEYDHIIDMLLMSCIYWAPFSRLQQTFDIHKDYRTHAWSIMHHLLTEKGQKELKTIISL